MDPDKSDNCGCPKRKLTPDLPAQLPCPATEENIPKLKESILQHYKDSAFNCCEQQQLPLMKDAPPMQLFADKNAKPSRIPQGHSNALASCSQEAAGQ